MLPDGLDPFGATFPEDPTVDSCQRYLDSLAFLLVPPKRGRPPKAERTPRLDYNREYMREYRARQKGVTHPCG